MPDVDDMALLREYVDAGSESAFAEIVQRRVNLVYSVALRLTGNSQDAQDVTQAVFVILAKKAPALRPKTILAGWLYETTRFTAMNFLTRKNRRQAREQEAYMQSSLNETEIIWPQLAPLLESAMSQLNEKDRRVVVLRYFENRSAAETAALLGVNEEAAQKRARRVIEKLRAYFSRRGVTSTAETIAGAISAHSIQTAPALLATTATALALAKGATASISTSTLIKGALKVMAWSKAQTAIVVGASVLLIVGTTAVTVEKIKAYSTNRSSWRTLNLDSGIVDQSPPQVRILPTKFRGQRSNLAENNAATKWAGVNMPVSVMMWVAYEWPPARVVFADPAPRGRYDFITSLPQGAYGALQRELKDRLGVVGRRDTRGVNALVLKVRIPDAAGLKPPIVGSQNDFSRTGEYICEDRALSNDSPPYLGLQRFLEGRFNMPVVDETGLTNHYSIDLKWKELGGRDRGNQSLKQALLDQLGLELVPDQRPIEMLVVEKAK